MSKAKEHAELVAKKFLDIETLETRNSDRLDFYDCAVWTIRTALIEMYELGKLDAENKKVKKETKINKKALTK